MKKQPMTTRETVDLIGKDRFQQMLAIKQKTLFRALHLNTFTASWYGAIEDELAELGYPPPPRRLFNFKKRRAPIEGLSLPPC